MRHGQEHPRKAVHGLEKVGSKGIINIMEKAGAWLEQGDQVKYCSPETI